MLTAKENFLETLKPDGKPDRLVKQYEGNVFFPPNPASMYIRGKRYAGMEPLIDRFGTTILWPEGQVAAMPHVTEQNKVIKDITFHSRNSASRLLSRPRSFGLRISL